MHIGAILLIALIVLACMGPGAILRALAGAGLPDSLCRHLPAVALVVLPRGKHTTSRVRIAERNLTPMRVGISISLGPIKLWLGTPRCRLSIGPHGRRSAKIPAEAEPENVVAREPEPPAGVSRPKEQTPIRSSSSPLELRMREDSIAALIALGFPKRQAKARVNAVTAGSSTEEIIKTALRGGHRVSK